MKFNFKVQQYQTDAVEAVASVFVGQGFHEKTGYLRDLGKITPANRQLTLKYEDDADTTDDLGYKNEQVQLSDEQLLKNIRALQNKNNIKTSTSLVKTFGRCSLDTKTIFALG